jgi:aurora kinase
MRTTASRLPAQRLKVTDFGLAVNVAMERPVTRLGTLDYMAPEVRALACCLHGVLART